ncbi:MAG: hypothetical protein GYB68_19945 [Chloroflexi bacterium]|nr:hypothetical protein [Chloroflexota bacterium]
MARIIQVDSTGKTRNQLMRTCAELLQRLGKKAHIDEDARNMLAMMVFCLREISEGIEQSAEAWEKRDYWVKVEHLRNRWSWTDRFAARIEALLRSERWENLPELMVELMPHFEDIKVARLTRKPSLWENAHQHLLTEGSN